MKKEVWMPESESAAVTLALPDGWTEISSPDELIVLVEIRIKELILKTDEPEWEVRHMLRTLDEAGLIDPYIDRKALSEASEQEIQNLLDRPELRGRILDQANVSRADYPLRPNSPMPEWYSEANLLDWANAVAEM